MNEEQNSKHLINLGHGQLTNFLSLHTATANYNVLPSEDKEKKLKGKNDLIFTDNEIIWKAVIENKLRRTDINIILDGFFLFEWFPRSPGLFHTEDAKWSREEAEKNIDSIENGVVIFNPYGKASMLDGGIGSIRLRPIEIKNKTNYLMTASSNGICHEGFPLAVPEYLYNEKCIEDITEFGAKQCKIIGKLQFVPDNLTQLYQDYRSVPQLYLQVEDVLYTTRESEFLGYEFHAHSNIRTRVRPSLLEKLLRLKPRSSKDKSQQNRFSSWLWVSVASSFMSDFEGQKNVYATYVTFNPSESNSLNEAVEWMEKDYIIGKYKGKVLTDFDEQQSNFSNAPFSLDKVMNLRLSEAEIHNVLDNYYVNTDRFIQHQKQIFISIGGEIRMGGTYNVSGGQQGAVGDNAKAENFTQIQNTDPDSIPKDLAGQINLLRELLKQESKKQEEAGQDTSDFDEAIGIVTTAKKAIENGEESKAKSYFASAGTWLLDFATKIGVSLVTEVIKQQTGLK